MKRVGDKRGCGREARPGHGRSSPRERRSVSPGLLLVQLGLVLLVAAPGSTTGSSLPAGLPSSEAWRRVLAAHVGRGAVDYHRLSSSREALDEYLALLSGSDPGRQPVREVTAFWINAYNAAVVSLVLDNLPDLRSVMEVEGFFDRKRIEIGGELLTLDEIESRALASGDPRVHFALVCAARSCPDLRGEPYVGEHLHSQLEDQLRGFLADQRKGAKIDADQKELWLSSLFDWYRLDFTGVAGESEGAWQQPMIDWVIVYLPEEVATFVRSTETEVRFLDYDWKLNRAREFEE